MNAPDTSWLKFWEGFATVGFILVIVGVIIEGVEFTRWVKDEHARKKIEKLGWLVLVVGLGIEFLGGHKAKIITDWQNARLNQEAGQAQKEAGKAFKQAAEANERAAKADLARIELQKQIAETSKAVADMEPQKQPIRSVFAFMRVEVRGIRRLDPKPNPPDLGVSTLQLGRHAEVQSNLWQMHLVSEKAEKYGDADSMLCYSEFRRDPQHLFLESRPMMAGEVQDWDALWLNAHFIPWNCDCEIVDGVVTVIINSAIRKEYPINPQKLSKWPVITAFVPNQTNATPGPK
jgi:hypothetical protein